MSAASVKVGRLRVMATVLLLALPAAALADEPAAGEQLNGRGIAEQFAEQARKVEEAHAARIAEEERVRAEAARIAAEKLAADARAKAEATRRALEQMKADEAEMLARARAEAEERLAEQRRAEAEAKAKEAAALAEQERQERARAEEAARLAAEKAEAERVAREEEARAKQAAEDARRREAQRIADEQAAEKARLAREAEERATAERVAKEQAAREQAAREQAAKELAAKELADRKAEEERQQAEAEQKVLEAERQAEAERLSERLRLAREARARREQQLQADETAATAAEPPADAAIASKPAPDQPASTPVVATTPEYKPSAAVADPAALPAVDKPSRVTVLLVMDPGKNGIRRFQKTADPILCVRESCYISTGPGTPATEMPRWRAFGTGNTLGHRAGACRNQLTCVFRDVDLGEREALIQPIDMRIMRHDRREPLRAMGDASCTVIAGSLHCGRLLQSKDWRAWIVPEAIAGVAGADVLQSTLKAGLPVNQAANLGK